MQASDISFSLGGRLFNVMCLSVLYLLLYLIIIIIIIIIIPSFLILGSPIGDFIYCSRFFAENCSLFRALLRDVSA